MFVERPWSDVVIDEEMPSDTGGDKQANDDPKKTPGADAEDAAPARRNHAVFVLALAFLVLADEFGAFLVGEFAALRWIPVIVCDRGLHGVRGVVRRVFQSMSLAHLWM